MTTRLQIIQEMNQTWILILNRIKIIKSQIQIKKCWLKKTNSIKKVNCKLKVIFQDFKT